MKPDVHSTRRQFLWNAGAAATLACAAASASARSVEDAAALPARVATIEDLNAIRELQREYARRLNAGAQQALAELFADHRQARLVDAYALTLELLADDTIEIAAGGTAIARVHCILETATPLESCPLVEMARAQGGGIARRVERGNLDCGFVKEDGTWKIKDLAFRGT